jgi:hypothetical protein
MVAAGLELMLERTLELARVLPEIPMEWVFLDLVRARAAGQEFMGAGPETRQPAPPVIQLSRDKGNDNEKDEEGRRSQDRLRSSDQPVQRLWRTCVLIDFLRSGRRRSAAPVYLVIGAAVPGDKKKQRRKP